MPESPGRLIAGQYRLIEQVGGGGFGVVWRARDDRLRRDVAAKQLFLPPHFTDEQRDEHRERTLREARSAARLTHPGVVTVHDVVEHDGIPWIIMEFVHGHTLGQLVRADGPLPPVRVAEIGLRLLEALRAAHAAGIIHRDVKPSNVIIGDRRVVLGDFGIAKIENEPELTGSGIVMGAPSYTAPERARGEPAVAASDLWSLGATLFYAVEGRRAFCGPNANATFHAILTCEPAPTRRAGPLAPILNGLLRKDATARMSAAEATERLIDVTAYEHPHAPRRDLRCQATELRTGTTASADERLPRRGPAAPAHMCMRRCGRDRRREVTRPTSDVPVAPLRTRRRPVVAVVSLTTLALLLASTTLRMDDQRRPAAPFRTSAAVPRLAATLPTGTGEVFSLAFSPDGRTIATGGADHAVRLWNVADRRLAATLAGHDHPVATAAFSPDGRTLATGGDDRHVRLWDVVRHRLRAAVPVPGGSVNAVAFSPNGRTLAYASGATVLLWNTTTGVPATTLDTRGRKVEAIAFSPDGSLLATAGEDATVRLWHLT